MKNPSHNVDGTFEKVFEALFPGDHLGHMTKIFQINFCL